MPVSSGSVVWMTPATSPSPDQPDRGARRPHGLDELAVPRGRSRMQAVISEYRNALGPANGDVVRRRCIDVDDTVRIVRADGDLVHIDVGREEQAALFRNRDDGESVGQVLGADRRAFERIERDIDRRTFARADFLADVEHRRLVPLTLADHHCALDGEAVEFLPHGIDAAWSATRRRRVRESGSPTRRVR